MAEQTNQERSGVDVSLTSETMSMHIEHTDEFGTVRGEPSFIKTWIDIGNQMREEKAAWIAGLRVMGVKAAHPDDGWVNRTKAERHDYVQFVYPQFNDGVKEGDLIALGWPADRAYAEEATPHGERPLNKKWQRKSA